jgi:chitooligosaccharide deacetylase
MWWIFFAAFAALTFAHFSPFPFILDWMSRGVSMWRVPQSSGLNSGPSQPLVFLTFDDGPNPTATPGLLDVLLREGVRATFFVIDRHLTAETAPIVRRAFAEGHGVALHSHTRRLMTLSAEDLARTLDEASERMETLTGSRPCAAFRPHGGGRSWSMIGGLRASGRRLVGWGMFLWDWDYFRKPSAARLVPRIAGRAGPGSIIVLHDGHHENPRADRQYTIETVSELIPALRAKGLGFGSICDVLSSAGPESVRGSAGGRLVPAEDAQRSQRIPPAGTAVPVLERKMDLAGMRVLQQPGAIGLL